jgi:2-C-methyl-D-erythritol 4-phosphate cytidylyltransferase/2-C-methyl-D-erythritol 2,4-cyclodiphosphate synthase
MADPTFQAKPVLRSPAMPETIALIVAGGRGQRLGDPIPKQYLALQGKPVLRRSVEAFLHHPRVDAVRVVIRRDDEERYRASVAGLSLLDPVAGGAERQDSARAGLESLVGLGAKSVLIHDAARPLVDAPTIERTLDALASHEGAIAALPVTDTVKRGRDGLAGETIDRAGLWRAQTPQTFRYEAILAAHRAAAGQALTDDAAVAEHAGLAVALVLGHEDNIKITSREDLERAARACGGMPDIRVGNGYDVHRFGPGDGLMLCGVAVAHEHGLLGHSDADVGLHAITDALLGAIGDGDIGMHFPPSDPRWKGADSSVFLRHALGLVAARGGRLTHVDVTVICERPKVGPQRAQMVARIAELLALDASRVSVKATTTEGLGFTGRREGIAAQATATVVFPA